MKRNLCSAWLGLGLGLKGLLNVRVRVRAKLLSKVSVMMMVRVGVPGLGCFVPNDQLHGECWIMELAVKITFLRSVVR